MQTPTPRSRGALAGVLAAMAGLAAAELVSGALGIPDTPVVAVGATFIDVIPTPVREFGIELLGTADKPVLIAGIVAVLAGLAAWAGILATRSRAKGVALLGALALLGILASATRPGFSPATLIPSVVAGLVAVAVLGWLLKVYARTANRFAPATTAPPPDSAASPPPDSTAPPTGAPAEGTVTTSASGRTPEYARQARRDLLRTGGLVVLGSVAATAIGRGVGGVASNRVAAEDARTALPLPKIPPATTPAGADLRVSGLTPWQTANDTFYRIDTALSVPVIEPANWRLRIHGMVDSPLDLTFRDLLRRRIVHRYVTLTCVSNEVGGDLAGNAMWTGVPLADILAEVGVSPRADAVKSTSEDGWTCGTPLEALTDGRDSLLAFAMNGAALPFEHGFPVRMVVPGLYGFVSATKWVVDIEVTRFDEFRAYWTDRGWSAQAPIKTASRIDVPRPGATAQAGDVVVAGVAWAQHRGISKVEVRVDEGRWERARLAGEPTNDSWRQWTWTWDAAPGRHRLQVRATDAAGETQTAQVAPPAPDGATGWHTVDVDVS
ncbi:molybdopterin-dependent oxidoreductase [Actinopolymorpha sp. B9G3]|uniref:molybdopterin-dependent oxidoreductase n=1 Tax=Actinopolymorpha sp. B9G3 TaxID=3158970 RepID=UPI0032D96A75